MTVRHVLKTMGLQGSWRIAASEVSTLMELAKVDEKTLFAELVEHAQSFSQAAISNFNVGAVCVGISGNLYLGANIEFAGCPLAQAIHGEQCAVTNAFLAGEKALKKIVISASPCGHCRQFMLELPNADDLEVTILSQNNNTTLGALIPNNFKTTLVIPDAKPLMQHPKQNLSVASPPTLVTIDGVDIPTTSPLEAEDMEVMQVYAVLAAATSYAPLTSCHSGVVLKTKDAKHVTGSVIESAAFNPTMLPLQVAYVNLLIHGKSWDDVTHVLLAEGSSNPHSASVLSPTTNILKESAVVSTISYLKLDMIQDSNDDSNHVDASQ
eukprot:m.137760 g.137760  ORF g.137760 m.137760 type:complete len:324 (+) comp12311_c0_seq1:88-1059(+)